MTIPRILHQIWIGEKQLPEWTLRWAELTTWKYRLWNETDITSLLEDYPTLLPLYERYIEEGSMNGASNIARVAILHNYGGVYIDADTEFVADFADADFMDGDAFMVHSPNVPFNRDGSPSRLANGVMGTTKAHSYLDAYIRALGKVNLDDLNPSWRKTGSELMTTVFNRRRKKDIPVLKAHTFLPYNLRHKQVGPLTYGIHRYGTTRNLYRDRA